MHKFWISLSLVCFFFCGAKAQKQTYPFQNPKLSFEQRANDLVSRLSIEEKISLMHNTSPAIDRLGIPAYNWWNECLHGVARDGAATVFPQAIGLAATWDINLVKTEADVISTEARAKHHEHIRNGERNIYQGLTMWSPNINIFRDPRWGRGQETYGEDPFLTAHLGVAFVKGLQGNDPKYFKVISTAKHFAVHSGPEPTRHSFDAEISREDLFDTYLPAFESLVREGKVYSVMGAYNRLYGTPCCANSMLLDSLLRKTWGFKGYVVSDCGAIYDMYTGHKTYPSPVEASAKAVQAGCDLTCGGEYHALKESIQKGLISEAEITRSVKRLLLARFRLGMFDPDDMVKYAQIPYSENNSEEHNNLARKVADESMVLLKNDGILPLSKDLKKIAVIGPNADNTEVQLGNYNGKPTAPISILQGIRSKFSPNTQIVFAQGVPSVSDLGVYESLPRENLFVTETGNETGLHAEYFDNEKLQGTPIIEKTDTITTFNWGLKSPAANIPVDHFGARWTGYIAAPASGEYELMLSTNDRGRLYINDQLVIDNWDNPVIGKGFTTKFFFEKDKRYKIKAEYADIDEFAEFKLQWRYTGTSPDPDSYSREALETAKDADVVIFAGGISPRLEGEELQIHLDGFAGGDRTSLNLPKDQEILLQKLKDSGKKIVLVLLSGSALSVNWEDQNLPAIIQAWYPGQQGGNAVADVLSGDYNPAGRLPVTFYKSVKDLPSFNNYNMEGRTYRYFRGKALYPFGYGLSYSSFNYQKPILSQSKIKKDDRITVIVPITNSSLRNGEEVVQIYASSKQIKTFRPIKTLIGFKRVMIPAGKTVNVSIPIEARSLRQYDSKTSQYRVYSGQYQLLIGSSSEDIRQKMNLTISN